MWRIHTRDFGGPGRWAHLRAPFSGEHLLGGWRGKIAVAVLVASVLLGRALWAIIARV